MLSVRWSKKSENMEAENVTDYSRMLQDEMGTDVQVGLPAWKDETGIQR